MAAPMLLGPIPQRQLEQDRNILESTPEVDTIEQSEWHRMVEAKSVERCAWGCFDAARFPLSCSVTISGEVLPAEASSLRSIMHADETMMATSLDPAASAWDLMPEGVLSAVPKE